MLAAQALAIEDTNSAEALTLALKAHKLDAGLVPAALVAARVYASQNSPRKTSKIIRETWHHAPHPGSGRSPGPCKTGRWPRAPLRARARLVSGSSDSLKVLTPLPAPQSPPSDGMRPAKPLNPFWPTSPRRGFAP